MRKISFYAGLLGLAAATFFPNEAYSQTKPKDNSTKTKPTMTAKYKYETFKNDPLGVKIYTLKNGLKVYMSVQKNEPRIQTYVAVRTGSRNDPSDATGLAHYLEHMLFKGTSKIGSLNWKEEEVILKQISDLFEQHRNAKPEERAAIYAQIDKLSGQAAKFVSANEYDRMISSLGAKGTNAYTSFDQTVYVNDIPSNGLEKWMSVESERFSQLVLRLFHTELEAVYEEFNISQARDGRKLNQAFLSALLPNHPYGTQTTIGTGEHLKTPSMEKIHKYFDTYYVPNNMAIVLSGDFNPDEAVAMVEKYFGKYKTKEVPKFVAQAQPEITAPIVREVFGKEKAAVDLGWRLPAIGTDEIMIADLASSLLSNGKAGLIDINLVQKQKTSAPTYAFSWALQDFGFFGMYGSPRQGQSLEEVRDLMLVELEKLRKGEFEDWQIEAIANDAEYRTMKNNEENEGRGDAMLNAFLYNLDFQKQTDYYNRMRKISKKQIIDFLNTYIKTNNYVLVFKREGEDKNVLKVEKPQITAVELNKTDLSAFKKKFDTQKMSKQAPVFVDFAKMISSKNLTSGVKLDYIKNADNKTFELNYIVNMGSDQDQQLPVALRYLPFLGTDKYTAEQLQQEFFKLGLDFNVFSAGDVAYVTLSGLDRSFDKGVELFEHILANVKVDEEALKGLIDELKKGKIDAKKSKENVLNSAMMNYARFGEKSAFKNLLNDKQLDVLKAEELLAKIKSLTSFEHTAFYFGSKSMTEVEATLNKFHKVPAKLTPCPARPIYPELETKESKVYFLDFKGVAQAEIIFLSKGTPQFDLAENVTNRYYNEYFGSGLSSIVFQEIRESRALAYSAYAVSSSPAYKNEAHYYRAFVGTQTDKMKEAVPAMFEIINNLPMADDQMNNALEALLKQIESERITKSDIYWTYRSNLKRGVNFDVRKNVYEQFKKYQGNVAALKADIGKFHAEKIKGRNYTILVLSDKSKIDIEYLKTLGKFEELTLEQVYGY
jgi:predicted Zn-dependent peptidase